MDADNKKLRIAIRKMPRGRAADFVKAVGLLDDEAAVIIGCDIDRKSMISVAMDRNMSYGMAANHRRNGYERILYAMNKMDYKL